MFPAIFNYRKQTGSVSHQTAFQTITPAQLAQTNEPLLILDVRSPEEYAGDGHIADSRLLPLPQLYRQAGELPRDQAIVCVCRSGKRSQVACRQLAELGFTQLFNLAGGMIGWRQAGLPIQR
jgi:rhodanese-related sulfurtransferase